jgi:hypothetical protein
MKIGKLALLVITLASTIALANAGSIGQPRGIIFPPPGTVSTAHNVVQWGSPNVLLKGGKNTTVGHAMKLKCTNAAGCIIVVETVLGISDDGVKTVNKVCVKIDGKLANPQSCFQVFSETGDGAEVAAPYHGSMAVKKGTHNVVVQARTSNDSDLLSYSIQAGFLP